MNRIDAWRMIQRRAAGLYMKVRIGCHTFRSTGITAYLEAGGTLENAQAMAAHEARARQSSTIELAMRSRSTRPSELLFEDGQRRLTGTGRCVPYPGDRRSAFIRQNEPSASPDTPSEFVPFPVNLTMSDHIFLPEVGN
jgi:hypothetical protein